MKRYSTLYIALVCSFAPIYALFSLLSLFPIIGDAGKFITLSSILAPLLGLILGPEIGFVTVAIGGLIGTMLSPTSVFGPLSFVPGATATLSSGLLYQRRRFPLLVTYLLVLLAFCFFPNIGPAWVYPQYLWFQILGILFLASPLQVKAIDYVRKREGIFRLVVGIAGISLTSTLLNQLVGSLMFEGFFEFVFQEVDYWRALWQTLTLLYPVERIIITVIASLIGVFLVKALDAYGFELGGYNLKMRKE